MIISLLQHHLLPPPPERIPLIRLLPCTATLPFLREGVSLLPWPKARPLYLCRLYTILSENHVLAATRQRRRIAARAGLSRLNPQPLEVSGKTSVDSSGRWIRPPVCSPYSPYSKGTDGHYQNPEIVLNHLDEQCMSKCFFMKLYSASWIFVNSGHICPSSVADVVRAPPEEFHLFLVLAYSYKKCNCMSSFWFSQTSLGLKQMFTCSPERILTGKSFDSVIIRELISWRYISTCPTFKNKNMRLYPLIVWYTVT